MLSIFFCGDGVVARGLRGRARLTEQKKTGFPLHACPAPAQRAMAALAPIHDAVRWRNVEALRRELERGVDPDLRATEFDKTALQMLP